jgi:O-antigen biosynthesis protein
MTPSLSTTPSVMIITGMHRSGTSLTASLLQSAGVNLGDRLMSEDRGNSKGHFEDLDFVEFHQQVLQAQELNIAGWTRENRLEVPDSFQELAKDLLATRQDLGIWGWKDPRTTLFLDFWSELIPDAKYVFVYRSPWDVVDSLFRRRDVIFQQDPNFALTQWCNYNQAILDFRQRYPDQCLLLNVAQVICNPDIMVDLVNQRWDWALRSPEILYEPEIFKANRDYYLQTIITKFFPEAANLYGQLQQQADGTNYPTAPLPADLNYKPLVLQDWINLKEAATKIQNPDSESSLLRKDLLIAQKKVEQMEYMVQVMESSKFWQLKCQWSKFRQKSRIIDANLTKKIRSKLKNKITRISSKLSYYAALINNEPNVSNDIQYQRWLRKHYPRPQDFDIIKTQTLALAYQPLISIIVPVYNPEQKFLEEAIASVIEQIYPHWELCLVDDCSSKPYVKSILESYCQKDQRIKVVYHQQNQHICRASNSALEIATGEYVALMDHDDRLAPHALSEIVKLLNQNPEADFIYSDEDKIDTKNIHQDPFFKPDWCPDSMLSRMYTCHLGVYRRSLMQELGGFRVGFEGSQDYDLVLRLTEKTNHIFHLPQVLYHWRIHPQSTSASLDAKPYAALAAQKAIQEAITRRQEPGKVLMKPNFAGVYTVRYDIPDCKLVSIIIPTKDLADTLDTCLKSIFSQTTYPNYEVIVIDNGSVEPKTSQCLKYWQEQEPQRFRSYDYDIPFNYSQINNYAVEQAQGDYLLFLNNDTEVNTPDWIEAMVEQSQRKSIGAVGSLLLYPDNTVQHAGVIMGLGGVAGHSHNHFPASAPGYLSQLVSINNYSAVTAACLMCRREVFESVGGFESQLAIAFNDVDFCLKLLSSGYRNVYLPHVVLYHYESKSRGSEDTLLKQARFAQEVDYMQQKWSQICDRDPCYNPNLSKNHADYRLKI